MKTLKRLSLPSEEMRNLKGGVGDISTTTSTTTKPPITTTAKPQRPTCGCSCEGCLYREGGSFFAAGMTIAGIT